MLGTNAFVLAHASLLRVAGWGFFSSCQLGNWHHGCLMVIFLHPPATLKNMCSVSFCRVAPQNGSRCSFGSPMHLGWTRVVPCGILRLAGFASPVRLQGGWGHPRPRPCLGGWGSVREACLSICGTLPRTLARTLAPSLARTLARLLARSHARSLARSLARSRARTHAHARSLARSLPAPPLPFPLLSILGLPCR